MWAHIYAVNDSGIIWRWVSYQLAMGAHSIWVYNQGIIIWFGP